MKNESFIHLFVCLHSNHSSNANKFIFQLLSSDFRWWSFVCRMLSSSRKKWERIFSIIIDTVRVLASNAKYICANAKRKLFWLVASRDHRCRCVRCFVCALLLSLSVVCASDRQSILTTCVCLLRRTHTAFWLRFVYNNRNCKSSSSSSSRRRRRTIESVYIQTIRKHCLLKTSARFVCEFTTNTDFSIRNRNRFFRHFYAYFPFSFFIRLSACVRVYRCIHWECSAIFIRKREEKKIQSEKNHTRKKTPTTKYCRLMNRTYFVRARKKNW